eukprot:7901633-Alexandrium_andersonii.AAC.1
MRTRASQVAVPSRAGWSCRRTSAATTGNGRQKGGGRAEADARATTSIVGCVHVCMCAYVHACVPPAEVAVLDS